MEKRYRKKRGCDEMECPICGHRNKSGTKFCIQCGHKFEEKSKSGLGVAGTTAFFSDRCSGNICVEGWNIARNDRFIK